MRLFLSTWTIPQLLGGAGRLDAFYAGTRNVLTYLVNIPLLFFAEQVLGPGWRNVRRYMRDGGIIFAIVAIAGIPLTRNPAWAMKANQVFVLALLPMIAAALFEQRQVRTPATRWMTAGVIIAAFFILAENLQALHWVRWPSDVEYIGFVAFAISLAYAVTERFLTNEGRLAAVQRELDTARRIQHSILPRDVPAVDGLRMTARYLPMTAVAGDFYEFFPSEHAAGGKGSPAIGVLVADASGHGVPAALIASMIKVAASSHRQDIASPGRLLTLMNDTLGGQLGGQFVTAICVYLDRGAGTATFAGAGHPPILFWRAATRELVNLDSTGVILGPFSGTEYGTGQQAIASGDRLVLYTDGLLEATDGSGRMFGDEHFPALLREHAHRPGAELADLILSELTRWSGKSSAFDDDVTLVIVDVL